MNDDTPTPQAELASAALDNEVSADERAMVQASDVLSREVEIYAEIRRQLSAVDVPAAARESALAVALAAFDSHPREAAADLVAISSGATVLPMRPRRVRQYRWLGGAAAAAAAAVVIVVAVNANRAGETKSSSAELAAATTSSAASKAPAAAPTILANDATGAAPVNSAATAVAAGTQGVAGATATTAAATAASTAGTTGAITSATSAGTTAGTTAPGPFATIADLWAGAPAFSSAEAIASFARSPDFPVVPQPTFTSAAAAPTSTAAPGATSTSRGSDDTTAASTASTIDPLACVSGSPLPYAPALYLGQRVLVVRDVEAHQARVVDPTTCAVVFDVPLP